MAPNQAATSRRRHDGADAGRARRRVHVPRRARSATASWTFLRGLDVLSVPATYDEPKGMFLLEAMAAVCRSFSRGAARSLRSSRRPAAACWLPPDDADAVADGTARAVVRSRTVARRWQIAAFDGVRAHYTHRAVGGSSDSRCTESAVRRSQRSAVLERLRSSASSTRRRAVR